MSALLVRFSRYSVLLCGLVALAGCGGGPGKPAEIATDLFLDGEFQQAIQVAVSVIDDAGATREDRAAMLLLKGRCYFEMGALATDSVEHTELLEQGVTELRDCLEFARQQAVQMEKTKTESRGEKYEYDDANLIDVLRKNLSQETLGSVAEAMHICSVIYEELGNEPAFLEAQRLWREFDASFKVAYESEGAEEVLKSQMNLRPEEISVEDPLDDLSLDDEQPASEAYEMTLRGGETESEDSADDGRGMRPVPGNSQRDTDVDAGGFTSNRELEVTRPLVNQPRPARTPDASVAQGDEREGRDETQGREDRPRSSVTLPRSESDLHEPLTSEQELAAENDAREEREQAEREASRPEPAPPTYPGSPYSFSPFDNGGVTAAPAAPVTPPPSTGIGGGRAPSGGSNYQLPPSTGIGGGQQYSGPVFNSAPSTGIGGGPSYGAGRTQRPGAINGLNNPTFQPPLPRTPGSGAQGIPLNGALPLGQRGAPATTGQQRLWPNYAPLNSPALPQAPQGLNGLPPAVGQPRPLGPSGINRPNFGAGIRLDGSSSR